ncbi:hypothetical protein [Streptomyces hygroscopicus]|uniref:hypothetical protein n=1 Tax=Streptomyces hygroscopicus TaxID=1912 RepID=UPI000A61B87C|nr:hypothetical protein [Streptomyces hygroscopicus]
MEIIDGATAAFGPYRTSPQPASAVLADIRALGIRVLSDLPAAVLREQIPADIGEAHLSTDAVSPHTGQAMERPGLMAPPRAADTAVAVTMALSILEQPGIHPAGEALRSLLEAVRGELTQISATSIDSWGRGISPVLQSVHLAALAPSLRPSEYVRYRIMTETPPAGRPGPLGTSSSEPGRSPRCSGRPGRSASHHLKESMRGLWLPFSPPCC